MNIKKLCKMSLFIFLLSLFLLFNSYYSLWAGKASSSTAEVGPTFLPRIVLYALVLSSFRLMGAGHEVSEEFKFTTKQMIIFLLYTLTTLLIPYASYLIGLDIAIFIYLTIWIYFMSGFKKTKNIINIMLYSTIGTIVITYIFKISGIYIPKLLLL